jgi:hypothetical protein
MGIYLHDIPFNVTITNTNVVVQISEMGTTPWNIVPLEKVMVA